MKLSIRHHTVYRYRPAVFLEPHTIRLRPRLDPAVRLIDFDLRIEPVPAVRADNLDMEGNSVVQAWFEGVGSELTIDSRLDVETLLTDPFRFLAADPEWRLPYVYPPGWGPTLAPYRRQPDEVTGRVRELALGVAEQSRRDHLVFPLALAERIGRTFAIEAREEGEPWPPDETLRAGRGACRDLAVLFVECCRAMGLAARFVSGYAYIPDASREDLHAWAEVYLPGGGWRGYDPTHGIAVADSHVVLAAAADPADAAPVTGSFRGDGATFRLTSELSITASTDARDEADGERRRSQGA